MTNKQIVPAIETKELPTPIVAPVVTATKTKVKQNNTSNKAKSEISSETKTQKSLTPKDLVSKLGINEKMVRIFLRKNYPEAHEKNKPWSISPELGKRIEKDYKAKLTVREAEKKARIEKDLSGNVESHPTSKVESRHESGEANEA